jgi:hypothetical protein
MQCWPFCLQDNGAVAVLHVASARITGIFPLSGTQQQQKKQGSRKALALAPADSPALGPEAIQSFSITVRSYVFTTCS